jgi:malonate decarboxylase beta subunit
LNASAPPQLLDALAYAIGFEPGGEAAGNLTLGRGKVRDMAVRVAIVENKIASGSLGSLECQRLGALFSVASRERSALVMHLDSAGARVSEGLKALGAFRMLYRAGLEAALSGTRIAVTLGRNCFGGSSMLAHLAPRRLLQESTQLAMSGPSIIATANGVDALDEMFRAMAQAAMSAPARAKTSPANTVWNPSDDIVAWLADALAPISDPAGALRARHETLGARLAKGIASRPAETVRRRDLEKIYAEGSEVTESDGFLRGHGTRGGKREEIIGIVGKSPLDSARAWRFSDAVWKMTAAPPAHLEVMLDCASHAPRLEDERIVLTEYIVDMGFALAALGARGTEVGLTVLGKAGGGVYVALAAPAKRVSSVYGAADIQVLPGAAVAAILGESRDEGATFKDYSAAGVADEELKLGIIPGTT